MNEESRVELKHTTIIKRNDGIVEVHCGHDFYYNLKELKEIISGFEKILGPKRYPILYVAGDYTSISREAREFGASEEGTRCSLAEAVVIKSLAQKLLADLYLKLNKPVVPTRFFNSKKEAEIWLKAFL
jgi:hypothetical protein